MQKDFHFYTIYALSRAAGFGSDDAYIIAYSSQHTDDAKYEHALDFENGGRFQQTLSAHKFFDPGALSKATCYRIWVPFHFLPGNLGTDFYERMLTRANSIIARRMVEDLISLNPKPYSLFSLGIILHVYADTWSHQNFMGIIHDMNDIKSIKGMKDSVLESIKQKVIECWAPKLGHTQAATIPDEPYRNWEYKDYRGHSLEISNHERTLDAAQNCYMVLSRFLERFPRFLNSPIVPWETIAEKIDPLFRYEGALEERMEKWREAISNGAVGFEAEGKDFSLAYDDREWFRAAVIVIPKQGEEEKDRYERKEGFEASNWKYFHDAAAFHKFCLLHELLPKHGIICG